MSDIFNTSKIISNKKRFVLPKVVEKEEKYNGTIEVYEDFDNKSEVNQSDYPEELIPERSFDEIMEAVAHDPRLSLSLETYVQMVLGSGIKVKTKKNNTQLIIREWLEEIQFETKLEDGLNAGLGAGNMIFERGPKSADFIEVDIRTIKGIIRDKKGKIKSYIQDVNNRKIILDSKDIIHFKLTNAMREVWGRGLFNSILTDYTDPTNGEMYSSPLISMKKMEDAMVKIFERYASPTQMFYFEDAGEDFIKKQASSLNKVRQGAKIVTDKKFTVETFEARGDSKFAGYLDHIQRNLLEPGTAFPLQFFNAGFTARAASESTDSVLVRKVKRIQKRLANWIKSEIIIPYLKGIGRATKSEDIDVVFEFESKSEVTVPDVNDAFVKNLITRSEAREWFAKNTKIDINQQDMENLPPINSVTQSNPQQQTSTK